MSIDSKHAYRFGYLKSDQWKNVRLEALVREKGCCQICGEESISNDAHHVWYPDNIYETTMEHLVIVCRPCHDLTHAFMPHNRAETESEGRQFWDKFRTAMLAWRSEKLKEMRDVAHGMPAGAKDLRKAYELLREKYIGLVASIKGGDALDAEEHAILISSQIRKWARAYQEKKENPKISIDAEIERVNGLLDGSKLSSS